MAQQRKLTRKQRAVALANLAKARRARFKKNRTGIKRFGKNRGAKIKVKTVSERARRSRRRNPINPIVRRHKRKSRKGTLHHVTRHWRKSAKRVAAGKKAAQTRKARAQGSVSERRRNPISKAAAKKRAKKAAATRRRNAKKMTHAAKTRTHRKGTRSKASYKEAAKRAAATRKRRAGIKARKRMSPEARRADAHARLQSRRLRQIKAGTGKSAYEKKMEAAGYAYERRRRNKRKGRRNPLPLAMNPMRRRRRHAHRMYNPLPNPMSNPSGLISKLLGFGLGYVLADVADRYTATHPLKVTGTTVTDQPAQGQIYDSEANLLPIWSNYYRLGAAAGAIALPLILSRMFARQTMQLAAVGAVVRTVGKVLTDGVTMLAPNDTTNTLMRLYGGELAAQQKMGVANTNTLPSSPPATFAGVPRRLAGPAPRLLAAAPGQRQVRTLGDCAGAGVSGVVQTDPLASNIAYLQANGLQPMSPWACCSADDGSNTSLSPYFPVPMGNSPALAVPSGSTGGGNGSGSGGGGGGGSGSGSGNGGGPTNVWQNNGNGTYSWVPSGSASGSGGGGMPAVMTDPSPMPGGGGTTTGVPTTSAPATPAPPTYQFNPTNPQ